MLRKLLHAECIFAFLKNLTYSWSFRSVALVGMVTPFLPAGLLAQGDWSDRDSCWTPSRSVPLWESGDLHPQSPELRVARPGITHFPSSISDSDWVHPYFHPLRPRPLGSITYAYNDLQWSPNSPSCTFAPSNLFSTEQLDLSF